MPILSRIPVVLTVVFALCCRAESPPPQSTRTAAMRLTSTAFAHQGPIPAKYTCDGEEAIPPLAIDGVPPGARSLALIVDDPDAPSGTWDHWVVWNIPPDRADISEGEAPVGVVGRNGWGKNAWGGPCPPSGEHRYVFTAYALDSMLELTQAAGTSELKQSMQKHTLASGQLVGRYRRTR